MCPHGSKDTACRYCDIEAFVNSVGVIRTPTAEQRIAELEAMVEKAKNFGADMMLAQMVKAVESGGRFSDERANDFVDAKAEVGRMRAELCRKTPGPCTCGAHRTELGDWPTAQTKGGEQ